MQRWRREANLDLVFQVDAGRALDLIEAKVVGTERRACPVVTPGVMERNVGLELARPGKEVCLIDPVFDDPSELGVARAPTALVSHMDRSKSGLAPFFLRPTLRLRRRGSLFEDVPN